MGYGANNSDASRATRYRADATHWLRWFDSVHCTESDLRPASFAPVAEWPSVIQLRLPLLNKTRDEWFACFSFFLLNGAQPEDSARWASYRGLDQHTVADAKSRVRRIRDESVQCGCDYRDVRSLDNVKFFDLTSRRWITNGILRAELAADREDYEQATIARRANLGLLPDDAQPQHERYVRYRTGTTPADEPAPKRRSLYHGDR